MFSSVFGYKPVINKLEYWDAAKYANDETITKGMLRIGSRKQYENMFDNTNVARKVRIPVKTMNRKVKGVSLNKYPTAKPVNRGLYV